VIPEAGREISASEALARLREDEARLENLEKQMTAFVDLLDTIRASRNALETFPKEEQNVLLPIGGGVYVHAKAGGASKVLMEVGGGVVLEKSVKEALNAMKERENSMSDNLRKMQDFANQLSRNSFALKNALMESVKEQKQRE
jgi:prefoldin alpha subunit